MTSDCIKRLGNLMMRKSKNTGMRHATVSHVRQLQPCLVICVLRGRFNLLHLEGGLISDIALHQKSPSCVHDSTSVLTAMVSARHGREGGGLFWVRMFFCH